MTGLTAWQTDDPCPRCSSYLTEISGPSSTRVIQQCRACAWSVTWAAPPLAQTGWECGGRQPALEAAEPIVTGGGQ